MMSLSQALIALALVLTLASAFTSRVPLWTAVFVLTLAVIVERWPR